MKEEAREHMGPSSANKGNQDPNWIAAEAVLDDAMARLGPTTRGLLVLKFFEGKTSREVGQRLGISEEAARKRISRAVDELREIFAHKGVALSAAGLAQALATKAVFTAPSGLAASAASAATALGAAGAAGTTGMVGGGVALMAAAKTKIAAAIIIGTLALGGGVAATVQVVRYFNPPRTRTITLEPEKLAEPIITGIVLAPDGKPAAGAEFVVGTPTRQAYAYDANPRRARPATVTDGSGKYIASAPPTGAYALMVRSPQGYVEVSNAQLARGGAVKLQPWGRIEGVLKSGNQVIPNANVHLWRVGENDEPVHHASEAKTDAAGKFVFPRVPPGEVCVYRQLPNFQSAQWRYVQLAPGQTSQVVIGGGGRSVVGRIDVPPAMAGIVMWKDRGKYTYEANVRMELPPDHQPKHDPNETLEQYWAKELEFGRTPAGKLYKEWRFGSHFVISPDGTFRVDDLPAGKYTLNVRCFEEQAEVNFMEDVARVEMKFEIPPDASAAAVSSSVLPPIDIGTATPTLIPRLRPGDPAPDFTVTTIDGQTWKYADHKGKSLVLVFWGTWGRDEEAKAFGEFARRWGKDARLNILGVFSARTLDEGKRFITDYKLDFPQVNGTELMTKFDNSWPSAVVVGADGKIMQKHLSGKVLEKYVNKAIGSTTQPKFQ
jgi:peroxiredoxin